MSGLSLSLSRLRSYPHMCYHDTFVCFNGPPILSPLTVLCVWNIGIHCAGGGQTHSYFVVGGKCFSTITKQNLFSNGEISI